MTSESLTEIETTILADQSRLRDGVAHCLQHRSGKPWPEWERKVLEELRHRHDLGVACLQYAQEVIQGRWRKLEEAMLDRRLLRKYLLEYIRSGIVSSPCEWLERRIVGLPNASAVAYMYSRWVLGKRWERGEKAILDELHHPVDSLMWWDTTSQPTPTDVCATLYTLHVLEGSWPAYEQAVEGRRCTPWVAVDYAVKIRRQPMPMVEKHLVSWRPPCDRDEHLRINAVESYTQAFPARIPSIWTLLLNPTFGPRGPLLAVRLLPALTQSKPFGPLEIALLGMPACQSVNTAIIQYTATAYPHGWKQAEIFFLRQRKTKIFRDTLILYAEQALKGRWPEIEKHLQKSTKHLLQYAERVVKGRLPDHLHNAMVLGTPDKHVQDYMGNYGRPKAC